MNNKEELILNEIINYYQENLCMPTRRFLQKKFGYKSVNSITNYIISLEKQGYLIRNKENKLVISKLIIKNNDIKNIKIINMHNKYTGIILNKDNKYLAYKIHNNYFNNSGILRNDILIIKLTKTLKENDLGLFIIDNNYRIMKYHYRDGFYLLKDKEEILLNRIKVIGKVVMVERKI